MESDIKISDTSIYTHKDSRHVTVKVRTNIDGKDNFCNKICGELLSKPGTLAYLAVKFLIEKEYLNQKQNRFNGAVFVPILHLCFNFIPKASKDTSIILNLWLEVFVVTWSDLRTSNESCHERQWD